MIVLFEIFPMNCCVVLFARDADSSYFFYISNYSLLKKTNLYFYISFGIFDVYHAKVNTWKIDKQHIIRKIKLY